MKTRQTTVSKALALALATSGAAVAAPSAFAEKYAAIVIDADTNEVLHSRNADDARYPASLTKVMTLYLLFDALDAGDVRFDEKLTVSRNAAAQPPSNLKLKAGATITVQDAIDALITKSANDVAVVVAERLGGTEARFARLMTAKAKDLGLTGTTFRNASGLPDAGQVSTARDLALLSERLLEDHTGYYSYFSQTRFSWGGKAYRNHNELLGRVAGVDGIKTGYTRASGFNLIASAERSGKRVIAVMLGGRTSSARDQHVAELLEAAFVSLGSPADTKGARLTLAFQDVPTPLNPDAAAEPTLNGKPLSVLIAEGSTEEPIEQGDGESTYRFNAFAPTYVGVATNFTVSAPMDAPFVDATDAPVSDVAMSYIVKQDVATDASVSEYERTQFAK